jgi:hypothetical protein
MRKRKEVCTQRKEESGSIVSRLLTTPRKNTCLVETLEKRNEDTEDQGGSLRHRYLLLE